MHDANNAVRMKEIISFSVRVGLAKGPQPAMPLSVVDAAVAFSDSRRRSLFLLGGEMLWALE